MALPPDGTEIVSFASPRRFLDLQRAFYRGDPNYVPPMTTFEAWQVDRKKNPFFAHAEVGLWVARRGGEVVGRISTTRDRLHDEFHGDRVGFFGHFEARDAGVAQALVRHAAGWLSERGATELRGPIDLSTNYKCGLLVEGEPGPPVMSMPYNPPSYAMWLEGCGLRKAKDLLALEMTSEGMQRERLARVMERLRERSRVVLRPLRVRRLREEAELLWGLYERIWQKNWGFAPMSRDEFLRVAQDLRFAVVPDLALIAEREGVAIGFVIGLPDVNAGARACNGRVFPFGWWKFLRALRKTDRIRVLTLGLLPEYRGSGIDGLLVHGVTYNGEAIGYRRCEASWVLEDNQAMLKPLLQMNARVYRRYRIYHQAL
jgi:GNAT superfamily N-acetyltransferase